MSLNCDNIIASNLRPLHGGMKKHILQNGGVFTFNEIKSTFVNRVTSFKDNFLNYLSTTNVVKSVIVSLITAILYIIFITIVLAISDTWMVTYAASILQYIVYSMGNVANILFDYVVDNLNTLSLMLSENNNIITIQIYKR